MTKLGKGMCLSVSRALNHCDSNTEWNDVTTLAARL